MYTKKSEINVLHLSTFNEDCGIGKYQENYLKYMQRIDGINNSFYKSSLNQIKKLKDNALGEELIDFDKELSKYDILHIQHEFGLFSNNGEGLKQFIEIAKKHAVKIIITIHTAPGLLYKSKQLYGYSPKHVASYVKRRINNRDLLQKTLMPLAGADLIITLNPFTKQQLIDIVGIPENRIIQTMIPVEKVASTTKDPSLRKKLSAKPDDIILSTIGFITEHKGVEQAIKALAFLPEKYKLAILGGINPDSGSPTIYNHICDLILHYNLQNRVYITGFIKDDQELYGLIRATDIALYPYDPAYYKLASSDAINKAIMNSVPVIAYPAESFKEINKKSKDAIILTTSANYYELAREVESIDLAKQKKNADAYIDKNNFNEAAVELVNIYRSIIS